MGNRVQLALTKPVTKTESNKGFYIFISSSLTAFDINNHFCLLGVIICSIFIAGCNDQAKPKTNTFESDAASKSKSEYYHNNLKSTTNIDTLAIDLPISCRNSDIVSAFNSRQSGLKVKGCGQVKTVLNDDLNIPNHQRFIVKLEDIEPKLQVIVLHNIDVSPRVPNIQSGDNVVFYGQYDYDKNGGIISQTHRDFTSQHQRGWIERGGERFQ